VAASSPHAPQLHTKWCKSGGDALCRSLGSQMLIANLWKRSRCQAKPLNCPLDGQFRRASANSFTLDKGGERAQTRARIFASCWGDK